MSINVVPFGPPDAASVLGAARQILEAAYYSFLTTMDADGRPTSRLLQHFDPAGDLTLRFGTAARSRKVAQIEANSDVLVACLDPGTLGYVVVNGTARVHRDAVTKSKYWREPWRAIWPTGPEGDDYLVLEIRPDRIEVVDSPVGSAFVPTGPIIVERHSEGWRLVEAGRHISAFV